MRRDGFLSRFFFCACVVFIYYFYFYNHRRSAVKLIPDARKMQRKVFIQREKINKYLIKPGLGREDVYKIPAVPVRSTSGRFEVVRVISFVSAIFVVIVRVPLQPSSWSPPTNHFCCPFSFCSAIRCYWARQASEYKIINNETGTSKRTKASPVG